VSYELADQAEVILKETRKKARKSIPGFKSLVMVGVLRKAKTTLLCNRLG